MGKQVFNKKGLTLVEVVVALAVFMIAVVMAYPIITYAGQSNIYSQKKMDLQEMGNYVAENISYIAQESATKDDFISRLIASGICIIEETPCTDAIDVDFEVGIFSTVTTNVYQAKAKGDEILITLIFKENSNIINITIEKDGIKYETLEYLLYEL